MSTTQRQMALSVLHLMHEQRSGFSLLCFLWKSSQVIFLCLLPLSVGLSSSFITFCDSALKALKCVPEGLWDIFQKHFKSPSEFQVTQKWLKAIFVFGVWAVTVSVIISLASHTKAYYMYTYEASRPAIYTAISLAVPLDRLGKLTLHIRTCTYHKRVICNSFVCRLSKQNIYIMGYTSLFALFYTLTLSC